MGGRIGYAVGTLPKSIQKLVQALNKKFGKGAVKTADEVDQPPKTTQLQISCLLYTSPSPRDGLLSRMPSSA